MRLQNGPFYRAEWAVLHGEMGRFAVRFGPFRKAVRRGLFVSVCFMGGEYRLGWCAMLCFLLNFARSNIILS